MPDVVVIAGPNGAGKSTLAPALLRDTLKIFEYVNADTIAEGLSAFAPERAAFEAGRVMLKRLNDLALEHEDFAFESTLATRSYVKRVYDLKESGYRVNLIYLWLKSPELAIERVAERVRVGGHNIPSDGVMNAVLIIYFDFICQSLTHGACVTQPLQDLSKLRVILMRQAKLFLTTKNGKD